MNSIGIYKIQIKINNSFTNTNPNCINKNKRLISFTISINIDRISLSIQRFILILFVRNWEYIENNQSLNKIIFMHTKNHHHI
jgi:hypothetical protein